MYMKYFACICAVITLFMAVLHVLLSAGAPIGEYVLGGKTKVIPQKKRWINNILALVFLFLGLFFLCMANIIPFNIPNLPSRVIMTVYTAFLAYAIIGNIFFTQNKKEKLIMLPCSIICFICSILTLTTSW